MMSRRIIGEYCHFDVLGYKGGITTREQVQWRERTQSFHYHGDSREEPGRFKWSSKAFKNFINSVYAYR